MKRSADGFATSKTLPGNRRPVRREELPQEAISLVGEFLQQFRWPLPPQLVYRGVRTATRDELTPIEDTDAQVILGCRFRTVTGVPYDFEIPVVFRQGELLEPSVAIIDGTPRVLAQSLIDEMTVRGTFKQRVDPRGGIFKPPIERSYLDSFHDQDLKFREFDRFNRGMFSVGSRQDDLFDRVGDLVYYPGEPTEQYRCRRCHRLWSPDEMLAAEQYDPQSVMVCPKCYGVDMDTEHVTTKKADRPTVTQLLKEIEDLRRDGYEPVDVLLAIHQKYDPSLAQAALTEANEKGLLDDDDE